jgi:predicted Rossmann fold flavoprotein
MKNPIIVIGGGAAGLLAAGTAAQSGAEVLLLEKKRRPGLKLCITGKGRCNITNTAELPDFLTHFGKNGRFLRQAFHLFFNKDLLELFKSFGLAVNIERGGRVFPTSGKATEVVDLLVRWVKSTGVQIKNDTSVDSLSIENGKVVGVVVKGKRIEASAVIIATGGASYTDTGSTGDGYQIAASVGHTLIPVRPALIPLISNSETITSLAGLHLKNIGASLFVDGKKKRDEFGELLFTDTGISGPIILTMSGEVVDAIDAGKRVELFLDLKPALDDKKLDNRLLRDFEKRHKETLVSILRGLLPKDMIQACMESTSIPHHRLGNAVTAQERKQLRGWMKRFSIKIDGYRPLDEAIITAGGVSTKEVDPRTMESKKVKSLYFAGEVLDIQADTGGYNLQAAFSTGWLAAKSAVPANEEIESKSRT